jgi:hypothetical protein
MEMEMEIEIGMGMEMEMEMGTAATRSLRTHKIDENRRIIS